MNIYTCATFDYTIKYFLSIIFIFALALIMSIYSGFATRNQEQFYDKVLYSLISVLLVRLSKFYQGVGANETTFRKIMLDQQKTLFKIEKRKYMEPKYSGLVRQFNSTIPPQVIQPSKIDPINSNKDSKQNLNRTLSLLQKEIQQLKGRAEQLEFLEPQRQQASSISLAKIKEKGRKKKKYKSKNSSLQNIQFWDLREERDWGQRLPSLPVSGSREKRNAVTRINAHEHMHDYSQISRQATEHNSFAEQVDKKGKALLKPPKFRAKMFYR